MRQISIKQAVSRLKECSFTEHIDDMQLALFREQKLPPKEREEVFRHLAHCKECREVLKIANEIEQEEQKLKPSNNINYKGTLRGLIMVSAIFVVCFAIPKIQNYPDEIYFKGIDKKSVLDKTLDYWEARFSELKKLISNDK
ncbi:MAG TPA: zf-HC2 domain-containing protein [Campylobacterales bacterium]|nr:zf-HC2 domain-containing protein [Campylobacterales bacterium]